MAKAILNVGNIIEYNRGSLTVACQMYLGNKSGHKYSEIWYWKNTKEVLRMQLGSNGAQQYMDAIDNGIIQSISGKGYNKMVTILCFTQRAEVTLPYRLAINVLKIISK